MKYETLHNHRHDVLCGEFAADVNVIELTQLHLVDAHQAAVDFELLLQQRADESGDVGVYYEQERPPMARAGQRLDDPRAQRPKRLVVGAAPDCRSQPGPKLPNLLFSAPVDVPAPPAGKYDPAERPSGPKNRRNPHPRLALVQRAGNDIEDNPAHGVDQAIEETTGDAR